MSLIASISPEVALRGTRAYVHSTDLYEGVLSSVSAAGLMLDGPLELRIREPIMTRARYELYDTELAGRSPADCSVTAQGQRYRIAITATSETIRGRRAYDETPAAQNSTIDKKTVRLYSATGLAPIETVTALAVHLHKTALPPGPDERWMLLQISLLRPLSQSESEQVHLTIDRVIGGTMTHTTVTAADGQIGFMVFKKSAEVGQRKSA